ncbi:MASE1 domain-containing protein [Actinopolymorpha pittospori]
MIALSGSPWHWARTSWPYFAASAVYLAVALATRRMAAAGLLGEAISHNHIGMAGLASILAGIPTAIALGCMLLMGVRGWPGILLAGLVANLLIGLPLLAAAAVAIVNILTPLSGYALMRRAGFRLAIDRLRDAIALVFLGAFAGTLIEAVSVSFVLSSFGLSTHFVGIWLLVWTGDAMAVLVVVPLLLVVRRARLPRRIDRRRWLEAGALLAGTFLAAWVGSTTSFDVVFLVFPFLIWAALRFQLAGTAPCVAVAMGVVLAAAAGGTGPFAGGHLYTTLITLQVFNGATALSALLLAVIITQRNNAQWEIETARCQLVDAMGRLDRGRDSVSPLGSFLAQRRHNLGDGA